MKKWLRSNLWCLLFFAGFNSNSQDIPIGAWRTHFSYKQAKHLAASDSKLFCATENGFFSYSFSDKSVQVLSKSSGLSDVAISALHYNSPNSLLIIGYESGLVDLVGSSKVETITDLKESTIQFDKEIKSIVSNGSQAYISNGLGVLAISLTTGEIIDNYRSIGPAGTDLAVTELAIGEDQLFALTEVGILKGRLSENLLDFNNWELIASDTSVYTHLTTLENALFVSLNETDVWSFDENGWARSYQSSTPILKMREVGTSLLMATAQGIYELENSSLNSLVEFPSERHPADFLSLNEIWIADSQQGLFNNQFEYVLPNGPMTDGFTNIRYLDRKVYGFYAQSPQDFSGTMEDTGYEVFDGFNWTHQTIDGFYNISDAAKFENTIYFSSVGMGIYSDSEGILNSTNSSLTPGNDGASIQVPRLVTSSDFLHAIVHDHSSSLHQLDEDGNWTAFSSNDVGSVYPTHVQLSRSGILWIQKGDDEGNGISAFDPTENKQVTIGTSQGLPSRFINGMIIDLNDEVWIASDQGIVSFPGASFPFEGIEFFTPFFENQPLFEDQVNSAVQTDGGNRIWIATEEKLSVFNSTFSKLEYEFTPENSPLPSGDIRSLTYNPSNGEMFILTENGLVSFRSNSSFGIDAHRNVSLFPNPVHPGFAGEIGIKGVYSDALIKITDISGKLIREVLANGATASWDLRDYNGHPVDSGVYIVLSNSPDGVDSFVGKLAVIR